MANIPQQLQELMTRWIDINNDADKLKSHSFNNVYENAAKVDGLCTMIYKIKSSESVLFRQRQRDDEKVDETEFHAQQHIYQRYFEAMDVIGTTLYTVHSLESDPETLQMFLDQNEQIKI